MISSAEDWQAAKELCLDVFDKQGLCAAIRQLQDFTGDSFIDCGRKIAQWRYEKHAVNADYNR